MLKTIMLSATALLLMGAAPVASAPAPVIAQSKIAVAATNPDECLLHAGCFFNGVRWICPNPEIYMNCLSPADPGVP